MKLFSVLKKDLLILLRSRVEMAVLFLMPLAFIIPISLALGAGDGYGVKRGNSMLLLPVVNYDQGPRAQGLMTGIGQSLKLEYGYDPLRVQSVGLQDDAVCRQAAAAAVSVNATATAQAKITPQPSATLTRTPTLALTPTPSQTASAGGLVFKTTTPGPTLNLSGTMTKTPATTPTPRGTAASAAAAANAAALMDAKTIAGCDEKVSRAMLNNSWRTAVLIIPENFSQDIDAGKPVTASLLYDPAGDAIQLQQIEGIVKGAAIKLSLTNQVGSGLNQLYDLVSFAPEEVRKSVQSQVATPVALDQNPALSLEKTFPKSYQYNQAPDTYQQTIPGYTVLFVFFIVTSMITSVRQERLTGTFRRLISTPVGRSDLLGGKLLATSLIGLVQVLILFGVGALAFKLNLGNDPLAFLLLTAALVLCAATLGLAVSTTKIKGGMIAAPLVIAALLGGCMFPLDLMPPFLRTLSRFVPHSWALTGYQNLIVRGQGLQEVFPQIVALLVFSGLFFFIAVRRFDFESQEAG